MVTKTKVTDYYQNFKPEIADTITPLHERVTLLTEQVRDIEKKLNVEQTTAAALKAKMQQMKERPLDFDESGQLEDVQTFKHFKETAVSLASEIEATDLTVTSLSTLLELKKTELANASHGLKNKLVVAIRSRRLIGDRNVNALLQAAFDEQNAFIAAFQKIYNDYGLNLTISDESLLPGVVNQNDVQELSMRIERFNIQQEKRS